MLLDLARALKELERPARAADVYARALAVAPDHPKAHYKLAMVLRQLGRNQAAVEHFRCFPGRTPPKRAALIEGVCWEAAVSAMCQRASPSPLHEQEVCWSMLVAAKPLVHACTSPIHAPQTPPHSQPSFRRHLAIDPSHVASRFWLAALSGDSAGAAACPPEMVAGLFDQYAEKFDEHLVDVLQYRTPELLRWVGRCPHF